MVAAIWHRCFQTLFVVRQPVQRLEKVELTLVAEWYGSPDLWAGRRAHLDTVGNHKMD